MIMARQLTTSKELLTRGLGILLILAFWGILAHFLPPSRLPSPGAVTREFFGILLSSTFIAAQGGGNNGLLPHLVSTIQRCLIGVTIGSLLGVIAGLAIGLSEKLRDFVELPLEVVRTIPPLAAVPFFLLWFGPGAVSQLLVMIFFCFMRVVIFTVEAIKNVPPVLKQNALTLGASPVQIFRKVILQSILPELIGGLRVVLATSWGIAVVAELMGSQSGIGRVFAILIPVLAAKSIMAAILWITIIAALIDAVFLRLSRHLTKWVPEKS